MTRLGDPAFEDTALLGGVSIDGPSGDGGPFVDHGPSVDDGPAGDLRLRREGRLFRRIAELWASRELLWTMAERDLRVRYKQAVLGFGWAVISPLMMLGAFTILFHRVAHVHSEGVPYPLFTIMGIVPWTFFSSSVTSGGNSIVAEKSLLNKVHFPREIFPFGAMLVSAADALGSTLVLVALFVIERWVPRATSVWAPLLLLIAMAFTSGITLAVSALLVYFRDLRIMIPMVLQAGMFVTPVAYSFDVIPSRLRMIYSVIDPMAPVIDGLRRSVLEGVDPRLSLVLLGAASSIVVLIGGYAMFKRMELGFADIA